MEFTPIEVAVALALYAYNVNAHTRARKLYEHFQGDCEDLNVMVDTLAYTSHVAATALPMPTAKVYVQHALDMYGEEARARVAANG